MKRVLVIALVVVCGMAYSDCFAKKPKKTEVTKDERQTKDRRDKPFVSALERGEAICQQALQKSKDTFWENDSASIIVNDLGWAQAFVNDPKDIRILAIPKSNAMPPVYRSQDGHNFSPELYPCFDFDTQEYRSSSVIAEHVRLDSALVRAKILGVDDIFGRSGQRIEYEEGYTIRSVAYTDSYTDYMRKAQFSCVSIIKAKKKYIVNATICIPNKEYNRTEDVLLETLSDEALKDLMNKYLSDEEIEEIQKQDTIK